MRSAVICSSSAPGSRSQKTHPRSGSYAVRDPCGLAHWAEVPWPHMPSHQVQDQQGRRLEPSAR